MKRRSKIFGYQILIAVALLMFLEIGLRLFAPQTNKTVFINHIPVARVDSALGYVLNPGSVLRHQFSEFDVTYTISNEGFNQPDEVLQDSATPKIAFVGDSYTFGMGTSASDCYVGVLSNTFKPDYLTINAGVLGYHTAQELKVVKSLMEYKPKLICLQIVSNDFQQMGGNDFDAAANLADTAIRWQENQHWQLHSVDCAKRMVIQSDRIYYALSKASNQSFEKQIIENIDTVANTVARIAQLCSINNCSLYVFFYPSKFMVTQGLYEAEQSATILAIDSEFYSLAKEFGFVYANPSSAMIEDYKVNKQDHHYRMDGHCTAYGNAFLAQWLSPQLNQLLSNSQIQ